MYNRRQAKILTTVTSLFTSSYVFNWSRYLPETPLKCPPTFDGRIVLYPSEKEVRDYFSWRQADGMSFSMPVIRFELTYKHAHVAHINNLYNTTFWALVQQGGETTAQSHESLRVRFELEIIAEIVLSLNFPSGYGVENET